MLIHAEKVCDKCHRNTHHVDYPCCRSCAGFVRCQECGDNYHHRKYPVCFECKNRRG